MNGYEKEAKSDIMKTVLRTASYLLVVLFLCIGLSVLCAADAEVIEGQIGTVDLRQHDFNESTVIIPNTAFHIYPDVFYLPEDFAEGRVEHEGQISYGTGTSIGENYGTVRVELKLTEGQTYAITAKNMSYAQRLFIDGEEYPPIGNPADNADEVAPKTTRYVYLFTAAGETTELVILHSNFVYGDTGGLYPIELGLAEQITRSQQLRVVPAIAAAVALVVAMVLFLGLFLFFTGNRQLLWFALACGCVGLRGLFVGDKIIMVLLPELDWYLAIRLEFLLVTGIGLFSALYVDSLFPVIRRLWIRLYALFCSGVVLLIIVTPPVFFSYYLNLLVGGCAAFVLLLVVAALLAAYRRTLQSPLSPMELSLLLCGLLIYTLFSIGELYAHHNGYGLAGLDLSQIGMMVFLFLNVLALARGFARTEQELRQARQSERQMQQTNQAMAQLDQLRTTFWSNISHELRTPLTIMSGYAQLSAQQIADGSVDEETVDNLGIISTEARRLARLAAGLRQANEEGLSEADAEEDIAAVIQRAGAVFRSILSRRNNRLDIRIEEALPLVEISGDGIQQVLLNLLSNANRHMRSGKVFIQANKTADGNVKVTVSDNGSGIDPALLPHVFERRVSGDHSSGIGLSICREIITAHGGEIEINSTPGRGTQVSFTLPAVKGGKDGEADHTSD